MHCNDYIKSFIERYNYSKETCDAVLRVEKRLDDEPGFGGSLDKIVNDYMNENGDMDVALDSVKAVAEKYSENEFTMNLIFLINCTPILKERYERAGIGENIFYDTMDDLRCKLIECIKCEEVPGIFVPHWYDGFFKMTRFAYGRFQFEIGTYDREEDFVMSSGRVVKNGDIYVNFHIPSSGIPLTDEIRYASYKKAYEVYKNLAVDSKLLFGCGSWLLYPRHREFLPKNLNILKFMDDFEMVEWHEKDKFSDGWRVFDKDSDLPLERLPRDTSLRRAYADWLCAGNKAGSGFGLFLFDGKKIVR